MQPINQAGLRARQAETASERSLLAERPLLTDRLRSVRNDDPVAAPASTWRDRSQNWWLHAGDVNPFGAGNHAAAALESVPPRAVGQAPAPAGPSIPFAGTSNRCGSRRRCSEERRFVGRHRASRV
jgi:hypothetical protein